MPNFFSIGVNMNSVMFLEISMRGRKIKTFRKGLPILDSIFRLEDKFIRYVETFYPQDEFSYGHKLSIDFKKVIVKIDGNPVYFRLSSDDRDTIIAEITSRLESCIRRRVKI